MGQHSPKDPVARLRGPGALKPRGPGGPSPPWTWGPEHLPGDFLAGWPSSICVGSSADGSTHPHKASCSALLPSGVTRWSHGLAPAAGGFCPAHPGRAGPGSQPGLEQLGSPSLQHRAATSLGRTIGVSGPTGCKYPPGHSPCCQGVLGQHPGVTATSAGEKFPPAPPPILDLPWKPCGRCCPRCCPLQRGMAPSRVALVPRAVRGGQGQQQGRCWQLWPGRERCLQPGGLGQARLGTVPHRLCSAWYLGSQSRKGRNAEGG